MNEIPIWKRYILTIAEAAVYYHIGENKLRVIVDEHVNADFIIINGNRILIKRERFEAFLDEATVVYFTIRGWKGAWAYDIMSANESTCLHD